jgi:glycosyltransferase involved in cell wall biosynthesis
MNRGQPPFAERNSERISVIIPAFNAENTLARAIASVRKQQFPVCEIIVVDDGSSDRTSAVAHNLGSDLVVLSQSNAGPSAARNYGARKAQGDFLAFLDADDYWYPEKLASQMRIFREHASVAFCSAEFVTFPTDAPIPTRGTWDGNWNLIHDFREVLQNPYLGTPTVVMRAEVFHECGGFDESIRFGEDVDLWMRAASSRLSARIPFPLTAVAVSASSLTSKGGESVDLGNLAVLAKFAAAHPAIVQQHRRGFHRAQATVHTRLASSRLGRGDRSGARLALYRALQLCPFHQRAIYLWFRSFTPLRTTP